MIMRLSRTAVLLAVASFLTIPSLSADAAWRPFGAKPAVKSPVTEAQAGGGAERLNRVEAQMRTLTGQIEEMTFQLRQLQEQLKRMQEDNEFRFRDLEGGNGGGAGQPQPRSEAPPPPEAPPSETAALPPSGPPPEPAPGAASEPTMEPSMAPPPDFSGAPSDAIGALAGAPPTEESLMPGLGAPPGALGSLTLDGPVPAPEQPMDLGAPILPDAGGPQVASISPSGDARTDYERAYGSILSGDYDTAEAGFRQFLESYPDNDLAPDAQYWLGESLFVRAQFREAANEFLAGYKAYPKSGKAPDALLKLGLSLAGLGERDAACSTFSAVLKQYPNASNALRQRIKVEQSSAGC
jgi:tol-pal system protein YbgF